MAANDFPPRRESELQLRDFIGLFPEEAQREAKRCHLFRRSCFRSHQTESCVPRKPLPKGLLNFVGGEPLCNRVAPPLG